MINVLYDNQVFTWQNCGGISRCFYELISNLDQDIKFRLPIVFSNNVYLNDSNIIKAHKFYPEFNFYGKDKIMKIPNQYVMKRAFKQKFEIFHPTYFDPYFLNKIDGKPFVLTIHDMTPERFPNLFPTNYNIVEYKKELTFKANKIIAVSEATKKDIVELYKINPDKIDVIYHGVNLSNQTSNKLKLPKNYILYVGTRNGYKNFNRLLEAFVILNKNFTDIELICTGSDFTAYEQRELIEKGVKEKVKHIYVNDSELIELYSSALLFVFPSLYEGFGLPILEAFSCKCPIALSNIECFKEIAQDAAIYFDPLDIDSIISSLSTLIENNNVREDIIIKGQTRLNKFSWEKSGKQLSAVYKQL